MNSIVVHYQEIALKGKNRPWFLGRLVRNIREGLADLDVKSVRALMGRIEVVLGADAPVDDVGQRLRQTFGIANFSLAGRARSTWTRLPLQSLPTWVIGRAIRSECRFAGQTSASR
jgi:adenylyl- and sulfurtransferase ThiI